MVSLLLNVILTVVFGVISVVILCSAIRARRIDYRDIKATEINSDLAAGHELLRAAMDEDRRAARLDQCQFDNMRR